MTVESVKDEVKQADLRRLAAAKREAEAALVARDEAQRRLDIANRALQAWQTIIGDTAFLADIAEVRVPIEFTGNKSGWVRRVIERHKNEGITPSQIRKLAREQGIEVTPPFPYTIIHKLKEAGKVREDSGRYFPSVPQED